MKKKFFLLFLCLSVFAFWGCKKATDNVGSNMLVPEPSVIRYFPYDYAMTLNVNNATDSPVDISASRVKRIGDADCFVLEDENSLSKTIPANCKVEVNFGFNRDWRLLTDFPPAYFERELARNISEFSFLAEIEGKKFLGFGRNEKVANESSNEEIALDDIAQDGLGVTHYNLNEPREMHYTQETLMHIAKATWTDSSQKVDLQSIDTCAEYDVVITDKGIDFSFKSVGRHTGSEP